MLDLQPFILPRGVTVALQILDLCVMVRIHARQPSAGWRTRVSNTRSHPRKDRHSRSIHARQPNLKPPFRMCADRAPFALIIIGNDLENLTGVDRKSLT